MPVSLKNRKRGKTEAGKPGKQDGREKGRERKKGLTGQPVPPAAWRGSYTVEAALVMPMILFVLTALIYASFYAHDCAVCQSLVCEAAAAGMNYATEEERADAIRAVKKELTESRFLGSRSLTGNASAGQKSVTASYHAEFSVPGFVMNYLTDNRLAVDGEWTGKIPDPTGTIRLIRGAGERLIGGDN